MFGLSGLCFIGLVWRAFMARRRYARRVIAPLLAKSLAPLNPSAEE